MIVQVRLPSTLDIQALHGRKPLCSTDSLADFHDVIVNKPWGSEYLLFENNDVAVWILTIEPGQQTSMHCHPKKNTSLIVLGGTAVCRTFEQEYNLAAQQGVYIGKSVFHQSMNHSADRVIMMEIESPVDKYDLVRLEDGYGRTDCGYESGEHCEHMENLTIESSLSNKEASQCSIGESSVTIGYAQSIAALETVLENIENATLSILDRHVWTSDGKKFYEVGQAFKYAMHLTPENLKINTGFHYLLISGLTK